MEKWAAFGGILIVAWMLNQVITETHQRIERIAKTFNEELRRINERIDYTQDRLERLSRKLPPDHDFSAK